MSRRPSLQSQISEQAFPQEYDSVRGGRAQSHEFLREHQPLHSGNDRNVPIPEYLETEPSVIEYGKELFGNPVRTVTDYFTSLFPIAKWILHYNTKWLTGDLIAGITVGIVLVPQSMSYAQLAGLSPEFGLYSSFVGVFIYSFFATSKDVSIGPVAVMSLQVGKVVATVQSHHGSQFSGPEIATFLSLICGGISAGIGLLRLGFILEFISMPAVMGFMSGSAFNIVTGQVPGLMGYNSAVNSKISSFHTVVDTLKKLKMSNVNAAFGLVPLVILYIWKFSCEKLGQRYPKKKMWFFYLQQLRNAIVIIIATAIAFAAVQPELKKYHGPMSKFKSTVQTIGTVPSGLKHVGVLKTPNGLIGAMASEIPVSTIILLLEHIAISKSFGRVNDYKVVPDQELIAIGVNNLIGTFFSAYPSTGSFSRSALKAKCGVRTPLAGIFTGCVVLLALYCLTSAFFYIPKATLSAIIIHAVSDLFSSWRSTWNLWEVNPIDCVIFVVCVFITVFSSIENGIYFAMAASAAVLLFKVAKPTGQFLGRVRVAEVVNPVIQFKDRDSFSNGSSDNSVEIQQVLSSESYHSTEGGKLKVKELHEKGSFLPTSQLIKEHPNIRFVTKWVPLSKKSINDDIEVHPPPPGVVVFRPIQSLSYPNASDFIDQVSDEAKRLTRRGKSFSGGNDRPWNDPGPLKWNIFKKKDQIDVAQEDERPLLRIVHFDFSCVSSTDTTSVQALVDLRRALNIYADREVEFHFSSIHSPWIRRALLKAGFGTYGENDMVSERTYVNIATRDSDLETGAYHAAVGTNTPFFHLEIPDYQ